MKNEKSEIKSKRFSELSAEEAVKAVEIGIKPAAIFKEPIKTDLLYLQFESPMISTDNRDRITKIFSE